MNRTVLYAPAMMAALLFSAVPARADRHGEQRGRAVERGRVESARPVERGRVEVRPEIRTDRSYQYRSIPRSVGVPRAIGPSVRYERPRTVIVAPRSYGYGYRSYGYRSYGSYAYRPYAYTFRPRLRIGFGVFLGYPVPYPVYEPYAYPAPVPAYGYPTAAPPPYSAPGTVTASPYYGNYGGVSFEITPNDAAVYVDGAYVGVVNDFYDPSRPLSLAPGRHHVELQASGFAPLAFDVDVVPGQVIPYRGDMQRY